MGPARLAAAQIWEQIECGAMQPHPGESLDDFLELDCSDPVPQAERFQA